MVTMKRWHCDSRKKLIYSDNMIVQQSSPNKIINLNKWLHSWERSKQIKMTKNNNQQQWRWYSAIFMG